MKVVALIACLFSVAIASEYYTYLSYVGIDCTNAHSPAFGTLAHCNYGETRTCSEDDYVVRTFYQELETCESETGSTMYKLNQCNNEEYAKYTACGVSFEDAVATAPNSVWTMNYGVEGCSGDINYATALPLETCTQVGETLHKYASLVDNEVTIKTCSDANCTSCSDYPPQTGKVNECSKLYKFYLTPAPSAASTILASLALIVICVALLL